MGESIFKHETLEVYKLARDFARDVDLIAADWKSDHCVKDHFVRASESVVINIASGAAASSPELKVQRSEFALGSVAECAACLDTANAWRQIVGDAAQREKDRLWIIFSMLWKLRRTWMSFELKDEPINHLNSPKRQFGHEKLDVYARSLMVITSLAELFDSDQLASRFVRGLDVSATSIVLNIAEGNGRVAVADRAKFFRLADAANTRSAALLDLCHRPEANPKNDKAIAQAKAHLLRIGAMLGGLLN